MRTIRFRGKDSNGNWHYGDLEHSPIGKFCRIHEYRNNGLYKWHADVDPETVGQFTGMLDKNGREIYEGDIIKIVEKFDDENVYSGDGVVCFEEGIYKLQNGKHFAYLGWLMHNDDITKLEVVGNIHDNPELLKGGKK